MELGPYCTVCLRVKHSASTFNVYSVLNCIAIPLRLLCVVRYNRRPTLSLTKRSHRWLSSRDCTYFRCYWYDLTLENCSNLNIINLENARIDNTLWNYGTVGTCVVVSALASINEVNLRRSRLVLRWATVSGFNSRCRTCISVCNQPAAQGQLSLPSLRDR